MSDARKIAVFTADVSYGVRKGLVAIDETVDGLEWLVVVATPKKSVRRLLRNQWRNLKLNGWRWIPNQIAEIGGKVVSSVASKFTGATAPSKEGTRPGDKYSSAALKSRDNFKFLSVDDLHTPATIGEVKAFGPTLGIALAAPILREPLFSIPKLGTINLHKGKVPFYRGMPPAFWELWNDEKEVGCTVHKVEATLDTGAIVCNAVVARERYSTVRGLQLKLDEMGIALTAEAVKALFNGAPLSPQPSGGRTYRKPTLGQIAQLRRRIRALQPRRHSPLVKILRNSLFHCHYRVARIVSRMAAPRVTVLLYHRVNDEVRDNLTVGIEQFERQIAMVAKHCRIVPIEYVIAGDFSDRDSRPMVCITFDDGYRDNFENAAPILLRHRAPAAFFVSTGIVESTSAFPHDIRRGNGVQPVMSWEQLRQMHTAGFTIGSHTVNHIDCAGEAEQVVKTELAESLARLRRELGIEDVILAYPYGGREHMTAERLEWVKQAGYTACLSAYGGINVGKPDRFNIVRVGVNWEFSDIAVLSRCTGF